MHQQRHSLAPILLACSLWTILGCEVKNGPMTPSQVPTPPKTVIDPKGSTAYIEVRPPEDLRQAFLVLSSRADIQQSDRQIFLAYASSKASGSGFAIASAIRNGTLVVTNRHVVDKTDRPQISFDGGTTMINADILYIDSTYDLAVLEIPVSIPPLKLNQTYAEMQDVYAVGYPGTGMKGSYQATRGTISNACLKESAIIPGGSDRCWIKHTAAIDPGSSGGPLVDAEHNVLGVNTAIVKDHHDMFLSVPANAVQLALQQAELIKTNRMSKKWMIEQVQEACHRFVSELSASSASSRAERVIPHLSTKIVAEKGVPAYYRLAKAGQIHDIFFEDPYVGMQLSLAIFLREAFLEAEGISVVERCQRVNPGDDPLNPQRDVRITISMHNGKNLELSWRFERGEWRLSDFSD